MRRGLVVLSLLMSAGCGLIDTDVTTLRYELYPVTYGLDTQQVTLPASFYRLRCDDDGAGCCTSVDCTLLPLACRDHACVTDFRFEQYGTIDLRAEAPALTRLEVNRFTRVSVTRIRFDVDNRLNLDIPPLDLSLAPVGVTSATDPAAVAFASLPALPAGTKATLREVPLKAGGVEASRREAERWEAFNLIVSGPLALSSQMAPLRGSIDLTVHVELTATAKP